MYAGRVACFPWRVASSVEYLLRALLKLGKDGTDRDGTGGRTDARPLQCIMLSDRRGKRNKNPKH